MMKSPKTEPKGRVIAQWVAPAQLPSRAVKPLRFALLGHKRASLTIIQHHQQGKT